MLKGLINVEVFIVFLSVCFLLKHSAEVSRGVLWGQNFNIVWPYYIFFNTISLIALQTAQVFLGHSVQPIFVESQIKCGKYYWLIWQTLKLNL